MGCFIHLNSHVRIISTSVWLDGDWTEFQVTLEIFDWVYVWTLLSLRQSSIVLSCYLCPWVRETPVSLSQPLWNTSAPWCLHHRQTWFHRTRKSCMSGRPLHVFVFFFLMCLSLSWGFWLDTLVQTLDSSRCRSFDPMDFTLKCIISCETVYSQIMSNWLDWP